MAEEFNNEPESLGLFNKKSHFRLALLETMDNNPTLYFTTLAVVVVNIIAIGLYDYHFRVSHHPVRNNSIMIGLEIICNIYLMIEAAMRIIAFGLIVHHRAYLRNFWNVINFISLFATYASSINI